MTVLTYNKDLMIRARPQIGMGRFAVALSNCGHTAERRG